MQSDHASLPVSGLSAQRNRAPRRLLAVPFGKIFAQRRLHRSRTELKSEQSRTRYIAADTAKLLVFIFLNSSKGLAATPSRNSRKTIPRAPSLKVFRPILCRRQTERYPQSRASRRRSRCRC